MLTNRDSHNSVSWNVMPGASRYELRESINGAPYTLVYNGAGLNWSPPSPKPIGRYGYTLSVCPTTTTCGAPSAPVTEEVVPGAPTGLNLNPNETGTPTIQNRTKPGHPQFAPTIRQVA